MLMYIYIQCNFLKSQLQFNVWIAAQDHSRRWSTPNGLCTGCPATTHQQLNDWVSFWKCIKWNIYGVYYLGKCDSIRLEFICISNSCDINGGRRYVFYICNLVGRVYMNRIYESNGCAVSHGEVINIEISQIAWQRRRFRFLYHARNVSILIIV